MSDATDHEPLEFHPTEPGELPEPLATYLRQNGEERATVTVGAADGWRHGSPGVNINDPRLRQESHDLMVRSSRRILEGHLSPGEESLIGADEDD